MLNIMLQTIRLYDNLLTSYEFLKSEQIYGIIWILFSFTMKSPLFDESCGTNRTPVHLQKSASNG